jgi:hypothetical protein
MKRVKFVVSPLAGETDFDGGTPGKIRGGAPEVKPFV